MQLIKNSLLTGTGNRPMTLDVFFENGLRQRPVVIYVHGFNGFKDWGAFDLIALKFARAGYVLVKFNFSHNGTTPGHPAEFADLEAFGNNNYTKELEDLRLVIDWVCDTANPYRHAMDTSNICLMGHSLGGGISILKAAEDMRVNKLITWASISECKTPWGDWPAQKMRRWKETGVEYYANSRTGQQMPLYYQLHEDYLQHHERLDIRNAIMSLDIPILICHGTLDSGVAVEKAYELKSWQPSAQLFIVESDHVFGRKHPWPANDLPPAMEAVADASLRFLKQVTAI